MHRAIPNIMQASTRLLLATANGIHRLPRATALALGRGLGGLAPLLARKHFQRICQDIALAFPAWTADDVAAMARESYARLGMSLIEFLRLPYQSTEDVQSWMTLEGREHLEAALARGKGAVLIGAHLGNWELCATALTIHGYKVSAITKTQRDTAFSSLINRTRAQHGLNVLVMEQVREALRVLKRNECLGNISDLNARTPAVFIQFFGRPAATYTGAAFFATATDAAVLPVYDERLPDGTHRVRIAPRVPLIRTGDRQRDLFYNTIRFHRVLEAEIARRPADWYWLLRRWHTRPEEIADAETIPMEHRDLTADEVRQIVEYTGEEVGAV